MRIGTLTKRIQTKFPTFYKVMGSVPIATDIFISSHFTYKNILHENKEYLFTSTCVRVFYF
jgi:Na+/citrate or Na+/malate symporter